MFSALLNRFEPCEPASVTEERINAALIKDEIRDSMLKSDSRRSRSIVCESLEGEFHSLKNLSSVGAPLLVIVASHHDPRDRSFHLGIGRQEQGPLQVLPQLMVIEVS
jgi:hypothetical protein